MRRATNLLSAFLVLSLAVTANAQSATGSAVKVKRGQTLSLSLLTPIDSGHANLGDDLTLKLVRPLMAEGATVLPANWIVHGKVTRVKRAGKNCNDGQVEWKLNPLKIPGGEQLKVQRVHSYPFKYFVTSGDPVWVPLDTPLKKVTVGATKVTGVLAVGIALSPLLVPMAILTSDPDTCGGKAGEEQSLPLGLVALFAASKDVRVTPLP
jgi:hypothetical protein